MPASIAAHLDDIEPLVKITADAHDDAVEKFATASRADWNLFRRRMKANADEAAAIVLPEPKELVF